MNKFKHKTVSKPNTR